MSEKKNERINLLLDTIKKQRFVQRQLSSAGNNSSLKKPSSIKKGHYPKYQNRIQIIKDELDEQNFKLILKLFRAKCEDLEISFNQQNWETFLKAYTIKNTINKRQYVSNKIDLANFEFGSKSILVINQLLSQKYFSTVILSKNRINPNDIINISNMKKLVLKNCSLNNDALEQLFQRLYHSNIEQLILSSPQPKHRNQLTKYQILISLIKTSQTLKVLGLSNIDIHKDNGILESIKGSSLADIDLSDNMFVTGICATIKSMNLARNSIVKPFQFPMSVYDLKSLNLSENKISSSHFKQFCKMTYFPSLQVLILDRINFSSETGALRSYMEQSISLSKLSMADCQFTIDSYCTLLNGIRNCRSLKKINLTRNRVANEKVAESISSMLQYSYLQEVELRFCDIRDKFGKIILKNIRRNKYLEIIDLRSNLLGDETSRIICEELKYAKNINIIRLEENTINYRDLNEIKSYLQANKFHNQIELRREYEKIEAVNRSVLETNKIMNKEQEKMIKLEEQTERLASINLNRQLCDSRDKKIIFKQSIEQLRQLEKKINEAIDKEQLQLQKIQNQNPENLETSSIGTL